MNSGDVILKSDESWLHFSDPCRVIVTEKLADVRASMQEVEDLVHEQGWHAAGFVSYEAAPAFDSALRVKESAGFPLLWFGLYENPQVIETSEIFKNLGGLTANWRPDTDKETYNRAIQTIKERIAQGKTYQVNCTMRLLSDIEPDALSLFCHLARSQNKYAAFLDIGDWAICSASHELFFDLDGDVITSRPMKGTAKRGRTTAEDNEQIEWLRTSEKNRAENVMIVDMIRNDLGRIAERGSVQVPELFTIEKYPTLFQMTSTIQARTRTSVTQIFSALFPCASITGAPKVSTMQIISELETSPRRIYTGSIGYISPNRKARFNVAIRTAVIDKRNKKAEYGIGGGIIWDSTSTDEYEEALLKAHILTEPPQEDFSLFETLLWTPEEGYFLLERHITRMRDSAEYFQYLFSETDMLNYLQKLVENASSTKRVKILLNSNGDFSGEVKEFLPSNKVFKVCLAKEPVNSNDRFLFHKTTHRNIYDQAAIQGCDDILLFNESNELTEFTIGNLVVEMGGELFTPPILCGLLAGTFRAELLKIEKIKERVIRLEELERCEKAYLVNSVRKWVEIEIIVEPIC